MTDLEAIRARDAASVFYPETLTVVHDRRALLAYVDTLQVDNVQANEFLNERINELHGQVSALREAARKVTCANCAGSGRVYRHPITVPQICPDCADLHRLLGEKP